jgi:hypothetical protein
MPTVNIPTCRTAEISEINVQSAIIIAVNEIVLRSLIGMYDVFLMNILGGSYSLSAPSYTRGYINLVVISIKVGLQVAAIGLSKEQTSWVF